jgi:hypothetical protein
MKAKSVIIEKSFGRIFLLVVVLLILLTITAMFFGYSYEELDKVGGIYSIAFSYLTAMNYLGSLITTISEGHILNYIISHILIAFIISYLISVLRRRRKKAV